MSELVFKVPKIKKHYTEHEYLDKTFVLSNISQKEIRMMNDCILANYPDKIKAESQFPNGVTVSDYCLQQIKKVYKY